jgi:hypothetical protein
MSSSVFVLLLLFYFYKLKEIVLNHKNIHILSFFGFNFFYSFLKNKKSERKKYEIYSIQ